MWKLRTTIGLRLSHDLARFMRPAVFMAFAVGVATAAIAADIESAPPKKNGDAAFILIDGEIKSGDDQKFRKIAAEYSDAIVFLNSEGGSIVPAMDIGRTIKLRGYKTAIYTTGSCASACALIWVAGSKRLIFEGGEVGFHASYLDTDGTKLETGVGNALVGHYLSQLGFGEKAVVFATLAPPDKILWLNEKTASMSGIDFETIPDTEKQEVPHLAEVHPTPPTIAVVPPAHSEPQRQLPAASFSKPSGYEQFMGDARQALRSPEAFAEALRQKGFQASVSYDDPAMPSMDVGVSGEKIAVAFSGCSDNGCKYIQLLDWFNELTRQEVNAILNKSRSQEQYSHPIWVDKSNQLAFYNYIVIGSEGISAQTLVDSIEYFVRSNQELLEIALDMRE